jgi:hypothetical protein
LLVFLEALDSDNVGVEVVDLNDAVADVDEIANGPECRSGGLQGSVECFMSDEARVNMELVRISTTGP